jgi:hypothetical protein
MAPLNEREVQATGDGGWFYRGNIASAVSGGFVPKLLHFNSLCHPRDVGRSELSRNPVVVVSPDR